MKSQATGSFPQFRFSDGQKWLFNPILKKRFVNRPEERVRLRYVDFLLQQTAFSKSRIAFETPVSVPGSENTLRADLVLYDRDLRPWAVIECKSEKIRLNETTAMQSARYNRQLDAPYLMITNGVEDHWFKKKENTIAPADNPIEIFTDTIPSDRPFQYWSRRGFLNPDLPDEVNRFITRLLNIAFSNYDSSYLNPPEKMAPFETSHYYAVTEKSKQLKLAYTFLCDSHRSTRLVSMLNQNQESSGFLWIDLQTSSTTQKYSGTVVKPEGRHTFDVSQSFLAEQDDSGRSLRERFENDLINFFD